VNKYTHTHTVRERERVERASPAEDILRFAIKFVLKESFVYQNKIWLSTWFEVLVVGLIQQWRLL